MNQRGTTKTFSVSAEECDGPRKFSEAGLPIDVASQRKVNSIDVSYSTASLLQGFRRGRRWFDDLFGLATWRAANIKNVLTRLRVESLTESVNFVNKGDRLVQSACLPNIDFSKKSAVCRRGSWVVCGLTHPIRHALARLTVIASDHLRRLSRRQILRFGRDDVSKSSTIHAAKHILNSIVDQLRILLRTRVDDVEGHAQ